ncbi:MAG: aminotransferase class I/II-fold pyridoxal phosphate-dependent enzyme [Elusimicrobiota bacterium]
MDFPDNIAELYFPPICDFKRFASLALDSAAKVYDLSQAVPGYPPPESIRSALIRALESEDYYPYTPDEGLPELRAAIAKELRRLYSHAPGPDSICVTAGANNAFFSTLAALAEPGDEVVFLAPYYFNHYMTARILRLKPVAAALNARDGYALDVGKIRPLLGPKTKALVLVNPSNPTGKSYAQADVDALFALCAERGVVLISDEVYNYFHDDYPRPASVLNIANFAEHAVSIHSYSKTFSLTGFRIGFVAAAPVFLRQFLKVHDSNVICAPRIGQLAAAAGLRDAGGWLRDRIAQLRQRVAAFRTAFAARESAFRIASAGAFFVYLNFDLPATAEEVGRGFVEKSNTILLPGSFFGPGQEGALRLALGSVQERDIPEVVRIIHDYKETTAK